MFVQKSILWHKNVRNVSTCINGFETSYLMIRNNERPWQLKRGGIRTFQQDFHHLLCPHSWGAFHVKNQYGILFFPHGSLWPLLLSCPEIPSDINRSHKASIYYHISIYTLHHSTELESEDKVRPPSRISFDSARSIVGSHPTRGPLTWHWILLHLADRFCPTRLLEV